MTESLNDSVFKKCSFRCRRRTKVLSCLAIMGTEQAYINQRRTGTWNKGSVQLIEDQSGNILFADPQSLIPDPN